MSAADADAQRRERVEEEREQRAAVDEIHAILGSVPLGLCLEALRAAESKYLQEIAEYYEDANEQQDQQNDEHNK